MSDTFKLPKGVTKKMLQAGKHFKYKVTVIEKDGTEWKIKSTCPVKLDGIERDADTSTITINFKFVGK